MILPTLKPSVMKGFESSGAFSSRNQSISVVKWELWLCEWAVDFFADYLMLVTSRVLGVNLLSFFEALSSKKPILEFRRLSPESIRLLLIDESTLAFFALFPALVVFLSNLQLVVKILTWVSQPPLIHFFRRQNLLHFQISILSAC